MADHPNVVIAFADKIYSLVDISDDLQVHEFTHNKQQRYSKFWGTIWWARYILSKKFRYSQELEAYRKQYRYVQKFYQAYKALEILKRIAGDLSGPIYGHLKEYDEALRDIQE